MSRFFYSKAVDFIFVCVVMFCAILVFIPLNNPLYISNEFTLGTLLFNPKSNLIAIANYTFNVLMFIPIGIFAYLWFNKLFLSSYKSISFFTVNSASFKAILFSIALSLAFELTQLLLPFRVTDLDDLILNTIGAMFGIIIIQAVDYIIKSRQQSRSV